MPVKTGLRSDSSAPGGAPGAGGAPGTSSDGFYSGRYQVIGPPGTGKTTFLSRQVRTIVARYSGAFSSHRWPNPVLVCSLTRAAAAEVTGRDLPIKKSMVGTLHAHCYRALGQPKLVDTGAIDEWNADVGESHRVSLDGTATLDGWEDVHGRFEGDALLAEVDRLRHLREPPSRWPKAVVEFHADWKAWKDERGVIDFTDLIAIAIDEVEEAPGRPAVIMVDEAQDLSSLEHELVERWALKAQATIVVGDPWQSLYTWRGADPSVLSSAASSSMHRRILSQSYRLPERVLDCSVEWVRRHLSAYEPIEYKPRVIDEDDWDPRGTIEVDEGSSIHEPDRAIVAAREILETGRSVMFCASCSYMLSTIIAQLRRDGVPFANPWRTHRRDWNPFGGDDYVGMLGRLRSFLAPILLDELDHVWLWREVWQFVQPMQAKGVLKRGGKTIFEGMADTDPDAVADATMGEWFEPDAFAMITDLLDGTADAYEAACWWHERLLGKQQRQADYAVDLVQKHGVRGVTEEPRCFVGTIHSFKGAEADVVFCFPDLSPVANREWLDSGEGHDSVVRMFYVAMTRARERLIVCAPATMTCVPLRRHVRSVLEKESGNG